MRRCECGAKDCDAVVYMTWEEQDRAATLGSGGRSLVAIRRAVAFDGG
jgi:hypothetical protein